MLGANPAAPRADPVAAGVQRTPIETMQAKTSRSVLHVVDSSKSVADAQAAFEAAAQKRKFGVLHTYDLKQTLAGKGFTLEPEVRVLEVCSPPHAHRVLTSEIAMNMALPCRVSIWQDQGRTKVGMVLPTAMLKVMTDSKELAEIADEVERALIEMIAEAR